MAEKLEVEIALRDQMSTGLKQVAREIEAVTKKMMESGSTSEEAFKKIRKGSEDGKKHTDDAKQSVHGLAAVLTNTSRVLLGAAGVASGFVAVSNALEGVSQKRLALQNLATDLGFTSDKMYGVQRALARVGVEAGDAVKLMTNFGQITRDVFKYEYRSPVMVELQNMMELDFAGKFLGMVKAGADVEKQMIAVAKESQRLFDIGNPEAARRLLTAFQLPESIAREMAKGHPDAIKGGYQIDIDVAKSYEDKILAIRHEIEDATTYVTEKVEQAYNAVFDMLKNLDWKKWFTSLHPPAPGGRGGAKEPAKMGTFGLEGGSLSIDDYVKKGMAEEDKKTNRLLGEIADTLQVFERQSGGGGGGGSGGGGRYASLGSSSGSSGIPGGPAPLSPLSGRQIGRTSGRVSRAAAKSSSHAPIQTEQPISGGNYLVDQRAAYFAEMDRDPELRSEVMKVLATEAGSNPQGTQAVLETMVNRASMRGYKSLKRAIHDGFYGPVNRGEVARRGLSDSERDMYGKTIDAVRGGSNIADMRTNQGMFNESHGSRKTKIGNEWFSDMQGAKASQWAERQRANISGSRPADVASSGLPTATASGPGNVHELQGKAGIRRGALSGATRGYLDYASGQTDLGVEVVSGGQPASGPNRTGSHRHDFGGAADLKLFEMVDGKKRYLDMNIPSDRERMKAFTTHAVHAGATGVGAGIGYMGANTIHIGGGSSTTWGGSDWIAGAHRQGTAMRDRAAVDSSNRGKGAKVKGSVKAEVDFGNMPAASKKSGDELGKFKLLKLNAAPQGAKDLEGLMTPGDLAHTPYVP